MHTLLIKAANESLVVFGGHEICSFLAHNAKHGMIQRFLLKVGERGVRGHAKVGLDKRDALRFSEKLFENWCCLSRSKLDNSEGCDQKACAAGFHQRDRDGIDLSALAPSHGEQD